jgi:nitrogen regulatory protein P-II 2
MKLVVAMIQPQQLPALKRALHEAKFANMTCTNVLGTVPNRQERVRFRGLDHEITLFPKVRVEIAVDDHRVDALVKALSDGGNRSGGYGLIFVTELHDCVTIATGTHGLSEA